MQELDRDLNRISMGPLMELEIAMSHVGSRTETRGHDLEGEVGDEVAKLLAVQTALPSA